MRLLEMFQVLLQVSEPAYQQVTVLEHEPLASGHGGQQEMDSRLEWIRVVEKDVGGGGGGEVGELFVAPR